MCIEKMMKKNLCRCISQRVLRGNQLVVVACSVLLLLPGVSSKELESPSRTGNLQSYENEIANLVGESRLGQPLPNVGANFEPGGSVFANYLKMRSQGQGWLLRTGFQVYESLDRPLEYGSVLYWFSDLVFVNNSVGYVGRSLNFFLDEAAFQSGNSIPIDDIVKRPDSISAVYITQTNIFEGSLIATDDNWVYRFYDDGTNMSKMIGWETADVGDSVTSAFSLVASCEWISVERAGRILGVEPSELTPDTFTSMYQHVWEQQNEEPSPSSGINTAFSFARGSVVSSLIIIGVIDTALNLMLYT